MSSGITFAKVVVAFVLLGVFLGAEPAMDFMRRHDMWPGATAGVRPPATSLAAAAASGKALPRTSPPAKNTPGRGAAKKKKKGSEAYDVYQVPAASVLAGFVRAPLDSQTAHVEDPVRAILRSSIKQDGVELIPAASIIHGKVLDVIPASRWQPRGRIVVGFSFIEHASTRSRAGIGARPVIFEAVDATGSKRTIDVRVNAGEVVHITLTEPLIVRIPK